MKASQDEIPVKSPVELPAAVHRDLIAYAEIMSGVEGDKIEPQRLVAPMLTHFMANDRGCKKAKRAKRK